MASTDEVSVLGKLECHMGWVIGGILEMAGVFLKLGLLQSRGWILPSILAGCGAEK
jgi:hypothetical protein